jgi:sugar phosphate isomerase/epimerase
MTDETSATDVVDHDLARPRIAAFPKGFFHQLIALDGMSIEDFIRRAPGMGLSGVELYPKFLNGTDEAHIRHLRAVADGAGIELPLMCSSPDFVDPTPGAWDQAVAEMLKLVDVMDRLSPEDSWRSVRVLSGQAWPEVSEADGLSRAVEGIEAVVTYAAKKRVWVVLENHYKDGLWTYPEFAQSSARFLAIVGRISSPWFGVNFDPSNALVAGEDPLWLLDQVADRVRSVGASDRSLRAGFTLNDLRSHRGQGYPDALHHGIVGGGLNDYDAIFARLAAAGFGGWVSIEDGEAGGEQGFADIAASAAFLHGRIEAYWPTGTGPIWSAARELDSDTPSAAERSSPSATEEAGP